MKTARQSELELAALRGSTAAEDPDPPIRPKPPITSEDRERARVEANNAPRPTGRNSASEPWIAYIGVDGVYPAAFGGGPWWGPT